jgi:hypothetical protein
MTDDHWPRQLSVEELRCAGLDMAMDRLWSGYERELSRTWRGRLSLRLVRVWLRLTARGPRSARPGGLRS